MSTYWSQYEKYAEGGNETLTFGDLVKPFGRKYKGMWRIFGISEYGEIMLISDKCIGECSLKGIDGYKTGVDQLEQICVDTVKSKKIASVRSVSSIDLENARLCGEECRNALEEHIFSCNYWLDMTYIYRVPNNQELVEHGINAVFDGKEVYIPLSMSDGSECGEKLGVRAIVTLRRNVEFKKTKDGYWKI